MPSGRLNNALFRAVSPTTGKPLSLGRVYTYEPGTTTPKTSWQDKAKAVANANPVILNSAGEAIIFLDGEYDLHVHDSNDALIRTITDVYAAPDEVEVQALITASLANVSAPFGVRSISASETLTIGDASKLLLVDASAGNVTLTLPTAGTMTGSTAPVTIRRTDSVAGNAVTISVAGGGLIDGVTDKELQHIGDSATIRSDGASYYTENSLFAADFWGNAVVDLSANKTMANADIGRRYTSSADVTVTADPATLNDRFSVDLVAGSGTKITINDGSSDIATLYAGDSATVFAFGASLYVDERRKARVGTWSPNFHDFTGNAATGMGGSGIWRRVGDMVECNFTLTNGSFSGLTGDLYIGPLPFAPSPTVVGEYRPIGPWYNIGAISELWLGAAGNPAGVASLQVVTAPNLNGPDTILQHSDIGVSAEIHGKFRYITEAA